MGNYLATEGSMAKALRVGCIEGQWVREYQAVRGEHSTTMLTCDGVRSEKYIHLRGVPGEY